MIKKRKKHDESEDVMPIESVFIPDDADEKFFSDTSNFIDDTPYVRPINEKFDKDGLYIFQHIVILYLAILAGYFPDELYPTTKAKCLQYYEDRSLIDIQVTPGTFIKTYSKFVKIEIEKGNRVITKDKYIRSDFIEKITPFIKQWYLSAIVFLDTLNTAPYRLIAKHYYWIYREVQSKYRGSWEEFRVEYCGHIKHETFRTMVKRNSGTKTPKKIKKYITPYIEFHFSGETETD